MYIRMTGHTRPRGVLNNGGSAVGPASIRAPVLHENYGIRLCTAPSPAPRPLCCAPPHLTIIAPGICPISRCTTRAWAATPVPSTRTHKEHTE